MRKKLPFSSSGGYALVHENRSPTTFQRSPWYYLPEKGDCPDRWNYLLGKNIIVFFLTASKFKLKISRKNWTIMKALGIPQPGAWLIINGYHSTVPLPKRTSYRGDVIIYALPELITQEAYQWFLDGCRQLKISSYPRLSGFDYSGFLGTAKIVECEISESGDALAILEEPTELGYVESKGELGIFDVSEDPFPIISNSKPGYSSTPSSSFKSRASSYSWPATAYDIDDESNEPSLLGHVITGVEQQAKRELNKVGRNLAKGAFEVGADLLGSWLGGGKPRRR